MTKLLYIKIIIILLFNISSAQTPALKIADTTAQAGQYIEIPIHASNLANIGAVSLKISFSTDALEFVSLQNPAVGFDVSYSNGVLTLGWFTMSNYLSITSGKLVDLAFNYKSGSSGISFIENQCELNSSEGNVIATDFISGSISLITEINETDNKIKDFNLFQNYPNPFNPVTKIFYSIPENLFVELRLYDCLGNTMLTLVNEEQGPGIYSVEVNSNNLANGIYFYRLIAGRHIETRKMIVIK